MATQKNNTTEGLPSWITEAEFNKLKPGKDLELIEIDSLVQPGKKLEAIITPPDDIAYSASMRYITNAQANTNDVVKMQQVLFTHCFVKGSPELEAEMRDESRKIRHQLAIGTFIGTAYPLPEARLKKSLRKAS